MDIRKKSFLQAYEACLGNITNACKVVGIERKTFYNWKNSDKEFAENIDALNPTEIALDIAENALFEEIKKGNTTAIIFYLKTKGKRRGYSEKDKETDYLNVGDITVQVVHTNKNDTNAN